MNTKIYWNHLSHAQSHSYGRKIFHHFRNVSVFFILRVRPPNSSSMNNTKAFFSFLVRGRKYCCCILILCFAWVLDTKRKRVPPSGIRAFIIICSFIYASKILMRLHDRWRSFICKLQYTLDACIRHYNRLFLRHFSEWLRLYRWTSELMSLGNS